MANQALSGSFRVDSVVHGSADFPSPIGGGVDEQVEHASNIVGTRITGPEAIDKYSYEAHVECAYGFASIVPGTIGTLTFTLLEYDSSTTVTVACAHAMAMATKRDFNGKPHKHTQDFIYNPGDTEDFSPITVTVG